VTIFGNSCVDEQGRSGGETVLLDSSAQVQIGAGMDEDVISKGTLAGHIAKCSGRVFIVGAPLEITVLYLEGHQQVPFPFSVLRSVMYDRQRDPEAVGLVSDTMVARG
jgi:hypothetical protein